MAARTSISSLVSRPQDIRSMECSSIIPRRYEERPSCVRIIWAAGWTKHTCQLRRSAARCRFEILSVRRIVSARPVLRFTPKCKRRSAWPRRTDTRTFRLPQSKARDTNVLRTKCSHISHPSWRNELSVAPEGDALQLLRYRRGELLLDH